MPKNKTIDNDFFKNIAHKLRITRFQSGKTQETVAKCLGITFQQIQKYESSRNKISLDKLILWANVTDTPVNYFISSDQAAFTEKNKKALKLMEFFNKMPDQQQVALLDLAKVMGKVNGK